ncbi:MAG: adenylate/guanylate cyclase domain-containing protein [Candidatus Binatia bacterium]
MLWLQAEGFASVYALRGGLLAWKEAGYPTVQLQPDQVPTADIDAGVSPTNGSAHVPQTAHAHTFLSGLVGSYATQQGPPVRRELAVLFVDIADSTVAVVNQAPETALAQVQSFMQIVTDIALAYCGDVKDYEGDGALLYFESITEATQAAFAMREALARAQVGKPDTLQARFSLNVGDVVIGVIGTTLRRSVALIGPSINQAARLLKQIPPGGIIATAGFVERLRQEAPTLAAQFHLWNEHLELKGFHNESVTAFHVP